MMQPQIEDSFKQIGGTPEHPGEGRGYLENPGGPLWVHKLWFPPVYQMLVVSVGETFLSTSFWKDWRAQCSEKTQGQRQYSVLWIGGGLMSFSGKKKHKSSGNKTAHPDGSHIWGCQKFLMKLGSIRTNYVINFPDACNMWFRLSWL